MLAVFGALLRAKPRPSMCPRCRRFTLFPDKRGIVWTCGPCGKRWVQYGAKLLPHDDGARLLGEEVLPTATLRTKDRDE